MIANEDIPIALIGTVGVVLAASIPAFFLWFGQRQIRDRIGVPNGKGNIAQMNEQQLERQTEHAQKLATIEQQLNAHLTDSKARSAQIGDYLRQGEARVSALEQTHAQILALIDSRADGIETALDRQDEAAAQVKTDLEEREASP